MKPTCGRLLPHHCRRRVLSRSRFPSQSRSHPSSSSGWCQTAGCSARLHSRSPSGTCCCQVRDGFLPFSLGGSPHPEFVAWGFDRKCGVVWNPILDALDQTLAAARLVMALDSWVQSGTWCQPGLLFGSDRDVVHMLPHQSTPSLPSV